MLEHLELSTSRGEVTTIARAFVSAIENWPLGEDSELRVRSIWTGHDLYEIRRIG